MIHLKKIGFGLLAVVLLLCSVSFPKTASADEFDLNSIYEPYFILVDADQPTVALDGLEREADKQVEPASTTKVLSCIVAIEETLKNGKSLNDLVTVSENAVDFGKGNSLMELEAGDTFPLIDLLYGMMLPSGNDAAIAIAEHVAGSTSAFVALMNAKAQELGMTHSHFETVHGKHKDTHYTTVRDMALLTAYALKNETFCTIVSTPTYTTSGGSRELTVVNSNRLLIDTPPTEKLQNPISCLYEYAIGVKTGDTTQAGKCLIAAARREGITLIAVLFGGTLGDPDYDGFASDARKDKFNAYRFQDAKALFEYEFSKMERSVTLQELKNAGLQTEFSVPIPNAAEADPNGGILLAKADLGDTFTLNLMEPKMRQILDSASSLAEPSITNNYAPIADGSVIGRVSYLFNGETLFSADLIATRSVKEGMAQVSSEPAQTLTGDLFGTVTRPGTPEAEKTGSSCGGGMPQGTQLVLWILLPVLLLLLIGAIVLFALYIRNERIRAEKRRKKAAARRRAQQNRSTYDE